MAFESKPVDNAWMMVGLSITADIVAGRCDTENPDLKMEEVCFLGTASEALGATWVGYHLGGDPRLLCTDSCKHTTSYLSFV